MSRLVDTHIDFSWEICRKLLVGDSIQKIRFFRSLRLSFLTA